MSKVKTAGIPAEGEGSAEESRRGAHLPEQASKGGQAVVEKYGKDYMANLGKKGSQAVIRKYGLRFYSEIAARNKGVKKKRTAEVEGAV